MTVSALFSACPDLLYAYTDRAGGKSGGPYASLNLAYHVGDDPAVVDANHALLAARTGYDPKRLIHMRQKKSRYQIGRAHV